MTTVSLYLFLFSCKSNSTTTKNVCLCICQLPKPPNSLKSIISPYNYLHHHSHHQTHHHTTSHTTLHTTSHTTLHTASSHNITHTPSPTQPCTWATFKLFSLLSSVSRSNLLKVYWEDLLKVNFLGVPCRLKAWSYNYNATYPPLSNTKAYV